MKSIITLLLFFTLVQNQSAFSAPLETPPALPGHLTCLDFQRQTLGYNNEEVIQWQRTTKDQYTDRALIQGRITDLYPSKNGHTHFAMSVGDGGIEVIYNDEFGELPKLVPGMKIIACGDYISVGPRARLPSPKPAIIHWVHHNPGNRDGGKHPSGFLIIEGKIYGYPQSAGI